MVHLASASTTRVVRAGHRASRGTGTREALRAYLRRLFVILRAHGRNPPCQVYSAASDGSEDAHSCRLYAYSGTSMSCPIVAGAAAMVSNHGANSPPRMSLTTYLACVRELRVCWSAWSEGLLFRQTVSHSHKAVVPFEAHRLHVTDPGRTCSVSTNPAGQAVLHGRVLLRG